MAVSFDQLGLDDGAQLATLLRRYYVLILASGYADGAQQCSVDLAFDVANERVQEVLGDLLTRAKGMAETTREDIRRLIGLAAEEGWSNEMLADEILARAASISPVRAAMIAATETATAYSRGSLLAYADAGVDESEWLTAEDEKVCPICAPLDGKRAALGAEFAPGIRWPAAHPNCRCSLLPVVKIKE